MSARRFRHRDRQQVRPGLPQQAPGGAPPGIRIRSIRHYAPPHTAARRFGLPAAYASGISDTAHHGHRVPDIRRTPDTGVRHTGLPAAYASEIKYPVFPTSGAAGRLASGMKKSDMKKSDMKKSDMKKSDMKKSDMKKSDMKNGHEKVGHEKVGHEKVGHEKVGHEKVGHEKGGSGIGFPFGRPLLCPHPGRRGYFFSGRAIDSRIDVSAMMFFIL